MEDIVAFQKARADYFQAEKLHSLSLKQKSRLKWAADSDENSRYFHDKQALPAVISDKQSAFIEGRQILDGILIANEIVAWASRSKSPLMLVKVDFAKAFDCVNWTFLDSVMSQMGFGVKWRRWMFSCFSSARLSVLVNVNPTEEFSMERRLRQSDPFSPFLFIIAIEALNVMMVEAIKKGLYQGFQVGTNCIEVSHLQLADDALFLVVGLLIMPKLLHPLP